MNIKVSNNNKLIINGTEVNSSKKVEVNWNEELQEWIPKIIDLASDIKTGEIKSSWKTHVLWFIITLSSILSTYYLTNTQSSTTQINNKVDTSTVFVVPDSIRISDTTIIKNDSL